MNMTSNLKKKDSISKLNRWELCLFSVIIFLSQTNFWHSISIFVLIGITIYVLFTTRTKTFMMMMFLYSNAENLLYGSLSYHVIIAAVIFVLSILHFCSSDGSFQICQYYIWFSFILALGVFQYVIGSSQQLVMVIKTAMFMCCITTALKENSKRLFELYYNSIKMVGCGLVVATICAIFIKGSAIFLSERFYFGENTTINVIGIQCAYVVVGLFFSITNCKRMSNVDIYLMLCCMAIGFMTRSRTFTVMIAVGLALIIVMSFFTKNRFKVLGITFAVVIVALIVYFSNSTVKTIVDDTISRFFGRDDISNGRYTLWEQSIDKMLKSTYHLFLGAGDSAIINASFDGKVLVAHNFIIETFVIFGVIGLILLYGLFASYINEFIFNQYPFLKCVYAKNLVGFVPIITMVAGLCFSHHFIGGSSMMMFILNFIPIIANIESCYLKQETKF